MKRFRISYENPETKEWITEIREFEDSESVGVTASEWAEDYAYTIADKGPHVVNPLPDGTAASGYSSPWRRTMDRCARYVRANPGCSVSDLVQNVDYHYSSKSGAKQGILLWLQKRGDVLSAKERGVMRFYPKNCPNGGDDE